MKRREFVKAAGLGLAAGAVASPAVAQSMPEIKWRLTSGFPKSLDTLYGGAEVFARQLAELTDNRFQVDVSPSGEIASGLEALEAVSKNMVEMCHTFAYYYVGKDPTFAVASAVPFALNARQQNSWLYQGGGNELLNEFFRKSALIGFPCGNTGAQMGGWFRKEVRTLGDMQGLKMRTGGIAGQVLARLGVVPEQVASNDIYAALEKGAIDAAEWVGPYDDEKLGFGRVAPFYYYPGWWEGGPTVHLFVNLDRHNSLPKTYQAAVLNASAYANTWMLARYDMQNPAALKRLVSGGVQLKPFPQEVMEAGLKTAGEIYAELGASNEDFRKAIQAMAAYRNDQYLWWQVAEYTYDNFMIRARSRA